MHAVGSTQVENVLALQRVGHVVTFMTFSGVVEQHANIRAALKIGKSQGFVPADDARPHAGAAEFRGVECGHGVWVSSSSGEV